MKSIESLFVVLPMLFGAAAAQAQVYVPPTFGRPGVVGPRNPDPCGAARPLIDPEREMPRVRTCTSSSGSSGSRTPPRSARSPSEDGAGVTLS